MKAFTIAPSPLEGEGIFQNEARVSEKWVRGQKACTGCDSPHPVF